MSVHWMNNGSPKKDLFLVTEDDLFKIDCMLSALNLAITEILERRPVREKLWEATPAQDDFNHQLSEYLYDDDPNPY
jgi:hypothetical protein